MIKKIISLISIFLFLTLIITTIFFFSFNKNTTNIFIEEKNITINNKNYSLKYINEKVIEYITYNSQNKNNEKNKKETKKEETGETKIQKEDEEKKLEKELKNIFTTKEFEHLKDVKQFYKKTKNFLEKTSIILLTLIIILTTILILNNESKTKMTKLKKLFLNNFVKTITITTITLIGITIIFSIIIHFNITSFNEIFIKLHEPFFKGNFSFEKNSIIKTVYPNLFFIKIYILNLTLLTTITILTMTMKIKKQQRIKNYLK